MAIHWRAVKNSLRGTNTICSGLEKTAANLFWSGENGHNLLWSGKNGGNPVLERRKRPQPDMDMRIRLKTCFEAEKTAENLFWSGENGGRPLLEQRKRRQTSSRSEKTAGDEKTAANLFCRGENGRNLIWRWENENLFWNGENGRNLFWTGENGGKPVLERRKRPQTDLEMKKRRRKNLFWSGENGVKLVLERIKRRQTCSVAACDRCAPWRSSRFPGRDCGRKWRNRMWGDRPPSPLQPENN
jgi:hypothetical protein